ncbi:MAG: hypothetical protein EOP49_00610 [Sphingobacteriales bacterium]|nr:MAG: hypothetical protein EOP49_00610 [Sphingobacteriales bacterium]
MEKHLYFNEPTFDKSYRAITRSLKLKPNEKALISHVITWQETTDKNGQLRNLECFESNATLSDELGIPPKTMEELIRNMNKKYDFFTSTAIPGKGKSRNGGNFNRTVKKVDMAKLALFLKTEQDQRVAIEAEQDSAADTLNVLQNPIAPAVQENAQPIQFNTIEDSVEERQLTTEVQPSHIIEAPCIPASVDDIFPPTFDWSNIPRETKNSPSFSPTVSSPDPVGSSQADSDTWSRSRVFRMCSDFEAEIIASAEVWEGDIRNRINKIYYERHRSEVDFKTNCLITGWIWDYQPRQAA